MSGESFARGGGSAVSGANPWCRVACHAMGCRWEIVLYGDDATRLRAAGEEAVREIERLDARLSPFVSSSVTSAVNARAAYAPVPVDQEFFRLLQLCCDLSAASEGAFDVTVGALMDCWGFREARQEMPAPAALEAARAATGVRLLRLDAANRTVRFDRPGVVLDFGAVGKGYALERAAEVVQDTGICHALIHAGTSSVYAVGAPPGEEAWKVAVRFPGSHDNSLAVKYLRDKALAVSAPHGRMVHFPEGAYGHVLDPCLGLPVSGQLLAVVVHPSPVVADALSTALLVRGKTLLPVLQARWPDLDAEVVTES